MVVGDQPMNWPAGWAISCGGSGVRGLGGGGACQALDRGGGRVATDGPGGGGGRGAAGLWTTAPARVCGARVPAMIVGTSAPRNGQAASHARGGGGAGGRAAVRVTWARSVTWQTHPAHVLSTYAASAGSIGSRRQPADAPCVHSHSRAAQSVGRMPGGGQCGLRRWWDRVTGRVWLSGWEDCGRQCRLADSDSFPGIATAR
jgi:hypothetical protein